jgi:Tfp pilus assembly protein PilO
MNHDAALVKNHEDQLKELSSRSLPTWTRGILVTAIAALFGLYGAGFAYNAVTYSTKDELKDLRQELKEMRAEIRQDLKELSGKLEPAFQRTRDK